MTLIPDSLRSGVHASESVSVGGCSPNPADTFSCSEQWDESVTYSPDGTTATVTILQVTVRSDTQKVIPNPGGGTTGHIGDTYTLRFLAPHLLRRTWTRGGFARDPSLWGNSYMCQTGLAPALVGGRGA